MSYKKYKAALIDLDGVIVDTARCHFIAWKRLAEELGIDFTEEDNEKLKGISRLDSLEILLKKGDIILSEEEKIKLAAKKNDWYIKLINNLNENDLLPGAKNFLERLKEKKVKISLCSASKNALKVINNLKIDRFFDVIIDGNMISKSKPDPEIFLLAAKKLNVKPEDCIVFEDAEAGIQAAHKANMFAVGVGENESLKSADIIIKDLSYINIKLLF